MPLNKQWSKDARYAHHHVKVAKIKPTVWSVNQISTSTPIIASKSALNNDQSKPQYHPTLLSINANPAPINSAYYAQNLTTA